MKNMHIFVIVFSIIAIVVGGVTRELLIAFLAAILAALVCIVYYLQMIFLNISSVDLFMEDVADNQLDMADNKPVDPIKPKRDLGRQPVSGNNSGNKR